ncbi:MAG: thioredoxin-disulfide reductase [Clostridia bacterium]|nr:thioredoxin-disulfide reductase [Clostridia bacterium]
MEKRYQMVIIGGGPAGYTAALYGARAGLSVLVIEKMGPGGQMANTGVIENYPGFEEGIDGFSLGMKMQQGAERFGAQTLYSEVSMVKLAANPKQITVGAECILADTVVIATGATPRTLGLTDEEKLIGKGLHYCAHCDGRFYKGKRVIVVGGGNSALTDALYLSQLAHEVHLVHRRDTFRAEKIYQDAVKAAKNVVFHPYTEIKELITEEKICGAVLKNNKTEEEGTLHVDGVFVSIGRKPAAELFSELEKDENGYLVAGEDTKTSLDGVYAVGDVRQKPFRQIVTAVSDGAVAVHEAQKFLAR